jgi:hypothetical protein
MQRRLRFAGMLKKIREQASRSAPNVTTNRWDWSQQVGADAGPVGLIAWQHQSSNLNTNRQLIPT